MSWCAHLSEGLQLEDIDVLQLANPIDGILLEEGLQDPACIGTILTEDVTLLDLLGTLPTCQRLLPVGDMADEVKVIDIGEALLLLQSSQVNATLS